MFNIMNALHDTIRLDIVLYQPTLGDVRLTPMRVDGEDVFQLLREFGVAEPRNTFLNRIASRYDDEKADVPFENVPPPRDDDTSHVYKIGEIRVDADGNVTDEQFGSEHRSHHIVGKGDNGGETQPTAIESGK